MSDMRHIRRVMLCFVALAGCHRTPATEAFPAQPSRTSLAVRISEGNLVAIVLAANNTDLSYARLVPGRARSNAVKTFAQRMSTDHTSLNNRIADIALRNGIVA